MVKGNSKQVIVVRSPEQKLFDQAIFILKDGVPAKDGITEEQLMKEAQCLIRTPRSKARKNITGPLWACGGAGIMALIWGIVSML